MANNICVIVLAVAVFGNIAFGSPRYRRSGITVVSGVDQNGQEKQIGRGKSHARASARMSFSDGTKDDFDKEFDHDFDKDFDHDFSKDFGHNFGHDFNKNFEDDFNNEFDSVHGINGQFQNNLALQEQTNRIAIDAANTISNRVGFPFQYTPPGPDFAYASGQIGPQDTYVKTEINEPNRAFPNLESRFQPLESQDPSQQHFYSISAHASTSNSNINGKESSSRHAEVITNHDGHVRKFITKDP